MQTPGIPSTRRSFLATTLALSGLPSLSAADRDAASAVAVAHAEIWRRFMDEYNIMIDFTDLDGSVALPTPGECREGKPNALGWWSPIENGAMFNGQYMEAMVNRWKQTGEEDAASKARRAGLQRLLVTSPRLLMSYRSARWLALGRIQGNGR